MDSLSQATRAAALAVRVCTWLRDEEANARERAPVMGADDRPNLTATDHSMWHPVELTHASERQRQRQRDQLPNHALLDQGVALRAAAGPASAPGSAVSGPPGARRAKLAHGTPINSARSASRPGCTQLSSSPHDYPARGHRV